MRKLIFTLILGFIGNFLLAQYAIKGTLSNENGNNVSGVHIHLIELDKVTNTDKNGIFQLENIPEGTYTLEAEIIGFETLDSIVNVSKNLQLTLTLKPDITHLDEVKVIHHNHKTDETIASHTLHAKTIEKYSSKTLGDALTEIEGVTALKTGSQIVKPVINGLHSSRVAVLSNGVALEDQEWGIEHSPSLDVNSAGKITVIKGANALKYSSNAIGGIVLVEPDDIVKKDTLFGKTLLSFNSNGRGGSLSSSLTKTYANGWYLGGTLTGKYMGDVSAPDYVLSNTGIRNYDAFFRAGFHQLNYGFNVAYTYYHSEIGILKASHIGNITDLVNAINSHKPYYVDDFTYNIDNPKQEIEHHLAKIDGYYNVENLGKFKLQYAFQSNLRKEYDIRRGEYKDIPALNLTLNTQNLNLDFESKTWNKFSFQSGLGGMIQDNSADPSTNVMPLIPNYNQYEWNIYSIFNYKPSAKMAFDVGFRYDYSYMEAYKYYLKSRWLANGYDQLFPQFVVSETGSQVLAKPKFHYANFSGSMGFTYHFPHQYNLIFNAGYLMRNPNPSELFSDGLHHSTGIIELGNLSLEQEKAFKFSVTLNHEKENFQWDIAPYINRINDFMQLVPSGLEYTIRGTFPVWKYVQNDALMYGVDANAQWKYSDKISQKTSFSYIRGRNLTDDTYLIDMPPFNWTNSITYNNPWHKLELTLRNQTFFTQKQYPNYNFDTDIIVNGQPTSVLVDISTPPKGYSLFDFSANLDLSSFLKLKKSALNVNFSVENIFDTTYRNYLNKQRFYAAEMGRNFMIQLKFNY